MNIDQYLLDLFVSNRSEWLTLIMLVITYAGSYITVIVVTLLAAASFYLHKQTDKISALLVSVIGSALTVFVLKYLFDRSRPLVEAVYKENLGSLPSGHAALSVALYGFFLYIAWKHDKHPLKSPFILFLFILILGIGVSRIYLGVHYFTDVIIGYIVGAVWLFIALNFREFIKRTN